MVTERNDDWADVRLDLLPEADAPAIARQFVTDHRDRLATSTLEGARLLVSELVTNAVQHGRGAITLRLRVAPPGIGVAVHDHGEHLPETEPPAPDDHRPDGRGLRIVAAVAASWGVTASEPPPGKTVWFELRDDPAPA